MANRFILPFADVGSGVTPEDGAKLFFFDTGTSNPRDTFSNQTGTTPNANPVIANQNGVFSDIFLDGSYKVRLTDKNDVQIWEADPVFDIISSDTVTTIAALKALTGQADNESVTVLGHTTEGDGGGGTWWFDSSSSATSDDIKIVQPDSGSGRWLNLSEYWDGAMGGALGDDSNDDGAELQSVMDAAATDVIQGGTARVLLIPGKVYVFAVGLNIPTRLTLDCNGAQLKYTGSGTAVSIGDDSQTFDHCGFLNFRMLLTHINSKGVVLQRAKDNRVIGYIEGPFSDFGTRTNVGVEHKGGSASGSFFDYIEVNCNHMNVSFQQTAETVQPTQIYYVNCKAFGDQSSGDSTSIGYNFADSSVVGLGDGTKITGGNIENVNTGIYFGQNSRNIHVNTRFEIASASGTRDLNFHATTEGHYIDGGCAGLNAANIGAVNGGIEGFDNGAHILAGDKDGSIREGGNADSFSGLSTPIRATNILNMLYKSNAQTFHRTVDDATGTGEFLYQPGSGSSTYGAFLRLSGPAHASRPMQAQIGPSAGGALKVINGLGGTEIASFDNTNINLSSNLQIKSSVPGSASSTGVAGTITWSSTFIYICIATDTWRRVAISVW